MASECLQRILRDSNHVALFVLTFLANDRGEFRSGQAIGEGKNEVFQPHLVCSQPRLSQSLARLFAKLKTAEGGGHQLVTCTRSVLLP